ncbi:MAG: ArsR/SmtB family transcription factor [Promethearchaeota archaeon]
MEVSMQNIVKDKIPEIEPQGLRVLKVSNLEDIAKISKVLKSPTRQKLLKILKEEPMEVSKLARKLNQTEANISAQIQNLQKVGLIKSRYEPGGHGVRKVCEVVVDKIIISLN